MCQSHSTHLQMNLQATAAEIEMRQRWDDGFLSLPQHLIDVGSGGDFWQGGNALRAHAVGAGDARERGTLWYAVRHQKTAVHAVLGDFTLSIGFFRVEEKRLDFRQRVFIAVVLLDDSQSRIIRFDHLHIELFLLQMPLNRLEENRTYRRMQSQTGDNQNRSAKREFLEQISHKLRHYQHSQGGASHRQPDSLPTLLCEIMIKCHEGGAHSESHADAWKKIKFVIRTEMIDNKTSLEILIFNKNLLALSRVH